MNAVQCKMARAAVGLGVRELAAAAKVSPDTVARLERGEPLRERTIDAIRAALEAAGVEFTNGARPGVRMKATKISMQEQAFEDGLKRFGPILLTNVQFDGLKLERASTRSCKLTWLGSLVGTASYDSGAAHFDPGVAHETADDTKGIAAEMLFADWAGAAIRRAQSKLRASSPQRPEKDGA
jgi:transcriptional regulator with XRE-family HTH domain